MPYGSYDHTITCGPNSKVCSSIFQDPQTSILPNKLATISLKLLEQLRSKSMLFNTNNLMYPVGGDFHWASVSEWTVDLAILRNVMEYINSRDELYTEVKDAQETLHKHRKEKTKLRTKIQ
ncbi:unnamed protein product [Allacma fusca]|uniref:Uncharacterized protein n=1 Tax=Allacma fusca TaxID=39272 RepID=A0A8J2LRK2_9HEXA|nr:unnamed protein product [Allacma fusca]